jgi:tetratricopeptide (TPR) repeat protein
VANEDSSYPPVDVDTDSFFASHGSHSHSHRAPPSDPLDLDERDPRFALKHTPGVALRRKELTKYVKVAVGLSAALCLAALVKVAVAGHGESPVPHKQASEPAQAPAPTQEAPQSAPPPAQEPAAAPTAAPAPAASASAESEPAAAPEELDPAQAAKEKNASRVALERGRLGAAIEAGERSVTLDPTDGEAWLILGAAYQEKGNAKDARRCYKACVEQSKRGPRNECAAMLR